MSITEWTPQDVADEHGRTEPVPQCCPVCKSDDTDKLHGSPSHYLPECYYWSCNDCGAEWGHT
jgi:hypothetical protein